MRWSVVVPVYNEADYLPLMLASLLQQSEVFQLIIVDNGSTDTGIDRARALLAAAPQPVTFRTESRPGQVHALAKGLSEVSTEYVAICDADTVYPSHYLATAANLLGPASSCVVAVCGWPMPENGGVWASTRNRTHRLVAHRLMPRQNHVNGGSQCFRTGALMAAGGYDPDVWPYVLKDHELMHRVLQHGRQVMHRDLWCIPSPRRANRRAVRWTLAERLAYHLAPFGQKHRFFHDWLAPRLAARGQADTVLRQQPWNAA